MSTTAQSILLGYEDDGQAGLLGWISPALLGLTVPLVLIAFVAPTAMGSAWVVIGTLLIMLAAVSVALYVVSVLMPGAISSLIVDGGAREIEICRESPVAITRTVVPFDDVKMLRMSVDRCRDGYGVETAQLVLRDGSVHPLPATVTRNDIDHAQRMIGRVHQRLR